LPFQKKIDNFYLGAEIMMETLDWIPVVQESTRGKI